MGPRWVAISHLPLVLVGDGLENHSRCGWFDHPFGHSFKIGCKIQPDCSSDFHVSPNYHRFSLIILTIVNFRGLSMLQHQNRGSEQAMPNQNGLYIALLLFRESSAATS